MNFASYIDFRSKVQVMLDGDDISTSDLSTVTLDLIIGAGEQRIYRDVRSSTQDTPLSLTVTGNTAQLPVDYLELRGAPYVPTFRTTEYMPWEQITNLLQSGNGRVNPLYYSYQGDALIFYPLLDDGTIVTGQYYKRFADLSTGLNALFTRHADLFLYASLAESAPFLGEMTLLPVWETKYSGLMASVNEQERRRITRGSKLVTRVSGIYGR